MGKLQGDTLPQWTQSSGLAGINTDRAEDLRQVADIAGCKEQNKKNPGQESSCFTPWQLLLRRNTD